MADQQSSEAGQKAQQAQEAWERGAKKVRDLEEDPPTDLSEWPSDEAKYTTFGGGEGDHGYDEGPERNLGPSGLRHHEDGSVSIDGEPVDDPQRFKGEPIPGGPTDPNAPKTLTEQRRDEG